MNCKIGITWVKQPMAINGDRERTKKIYVINANPWPGELVRSVYNKYPETTSIA